LKCCDPDRALRALALLSTVLAACGDRRAALPPRPLSIEPSVAYGSVPTAAVVRGDGFYVRGVQVASGGTRVETRHRAWLGPLELADVTWLDEHTLQAVIPAGLPAGTYDLTVENALGDRGSTPAAFRSLGGAPPALRAGIEAPPAANLGQTLSVTATVENDGDATALAVTPVLLGSGAGSLALVGSAPAPADIPGRSAHAFTWSYQAVALGDVALDLQGGGQDEGTGEPVPLPHAGTSFSVGRPATLAVQVLSAPALVNVGQEFDVTVRVQNAGDSAAAGATLRLAIPNANPGSADVDLGTIRGGTSQDVTRSFSVAAPGDATISAAATATDATDGSDLTAATSWTTQVQEPAALAATLSIPTPLAVGDFTATLTVVNTGGAMALGVAPPASPLTIGAGTGALAYVSGPAGAASDLASGQEATFTWVYRVSSVGTVQLSATVTGTDATSGAPLRAASTSNIATVPEAALLASDPFGDGTAFAFATEYQGQLWLGPSAGGQGAVSMNLDGSGRQLVAFALPKDVVASGTQSANGWSGAPPYPSIGALGCQTNSAACGPDNENGRGLFTSVTLAGAEWLVAIGAKPGGNLNYAYMTQATTSPLTFRYVDLSQQLTGETRTASAVAALRERLYVGFPGRGGQSPFLLVLTALPPAPGLDPSAGTYATTLEMSRMPYLGASGTPKNGSTVILVDALAAFSDRLYLANNGGFARSTIPLPRPYTTASSDWTTCTPAALVKTALTTAKQSDLEPADKAVPQLVAAGSRLFAIRNAYLSGTSGSVGGQLWRCTPTALDPGDAVPQCAATDWSLVVPDDGADGRGPATLLAASSRYLYLGFNRAAGARVYRSANLAPTSLSDFIGQGGCTAGSAGCQGLGGDGFGDPRNAHLLDARVSTDALGNTALFVTAGDPTAAPAVPVRVYRIPE